jgi:hypothetical protein
MAEIVPFDVILKGGAADRHRFQAYEGFNTFAGMSFTLALVANYVETGKVRHKGSFKGRGAVSAVAPASGSVIVEYAVSLATNPSAVFGAAITVSGAALMRALVGQVLTRNTGKTQASPDLASLMKSRRGDVEALISATEPSIRQAHDVIGNGAKQLYVASGINLAKLNAKTKEYIRSSHPENIPLTGKFTVTGFYGNSGHGSVFDKSIGKNMPFDMPKAVLDDVGPTFSWGLDQYTNNTGKRVVITYTRILSMDGTPKKYKVIAAKPE